MGIGSSHDSPPASVNQVQAPIAAIWHDFFAGAYNWQSMTTSMAESLRQATRLVAVLNLLYFGVEFGVAAAIGSVALFADSVDFLEDASVNVLILLALDWPPLHRARLGMVLAGLLLVPAAAALLTAWARMQSLQPPAPIPLSLVAAGAILVNGTCAWLLARYRHSGSSLARAAFLSARNDVLANTAIIVAALVTVQVQTAWPDLTVGIGIAFLNISAAREVWQTALAEYRPAQA